MVPWSTGPRHCRAAACFVSGRERTRIPPTKTAESGRFYCHSIWTSASVSFFFYSLASVTIRCYVGRQKGKKGELTIKRHLREDEVARWRHSPAPTHSAQPLLLLSAVWYMPPFLTVIRWPARLLPTRVGRGGAGFWRPRLGLSLACSVSSSVAPPPPRSLRTFSRYQVSKLPWYLPDTQAHETGLSFVVRQAGSYKPKLICMFIKERLCAVFFRPPPVQSA